MARPPRPETTTRGKASSSVLADRRDQFVREQLEKDRTASAAKTAKLRALRLAKEAAEKQAQQKPEPDNTVARPAEPVRRRRVFRV
jgi:hypothetical protein